MVLSDVTVFAQKCSRINSQRIWGPHSGSLGHKKDWSRLQTKFVLQQRSIFSNTASKSPLYAFIDMFINYIDIGKYSIYEQHTIHDLASHVLFFFHLRLFHSSYSLLILKLEPGCKNLSKSARLAPSCIIFLTI